MYRIYIYTNTKIERDPDRTEDMYFLQVKKSNDAIEKTNFIANL